MTTADHARAQFDEIDVGRINIIEPDGKYRMVISNRARSVGPLYKGKPFLYTGTERPRPGIIFFNDEGTENGGLTFSGREVADGGYTSSGHLSFDQFNQDQVFVIQYSDRNGKRRVGMQINDRHSANIFDWAAQRDSLNKLPDSPSKSDALRQLMSGAADDPRVAERVYVGRDTSKNAVINMSDKLGRTRLRLVVDSAGSARVEFLDADGRVTYSLHDRGEQRRR